MHRIILATLVGATMVTACGGTSTETVTQTRQVTVTQTETQPVTVTQTETAAAPSLVLVPEPGGGVAYEPEQIALGASSAIDDIRWKSYGGKVAVGSGIWPKNDCVPTCAEGAVTNEKVTVRLAGVTPCSRSGLLMYRKMQIDDAGYEDITAEEPRC